jgi:hypothetical protein
MGRLSRWTFWLVATSVAACTAVHLPGEVVIVELEPDAGASWGLDTGSAIVPRPDAARPSDASTDASAAPSPPPGLAVDLVDLDAIRGTVTGSVNVHHAHDETSIVGYAVHWADREGKPLPGVASLVSWVASGEDFSLELSEESVPAGGARLSVVPVTPTGEGTSASSVLVDAFASPLTEKFAGVATFVRDPDGSHARLVLDGAVRDAQVLENGSPGAVTCDELGQACSRALLPPTYWRIPFVSLTEDTARAKTLRPFFNATGAHWLECLRDGTSSCSLVDVTGGFGAGSDSEVARAAVDPVRARVFLAQRGGASIVTTSGTTLSTVPGYGVTEPEISNAVAALDSTTGRFFVAGAPITGQSFVTALFACEGNGAGCVRRDTTTALPAATTPRQRAPGYLSVDSASRVLRMDVSYTNNVGPTNAKAFVATCSLDVDTCTYVKLSAPGLSPSYEVTGGTVDRRHAKLWLAIDERTGSNSRNASAALRCELDGSACTQELRFAWAPGTQSTGRLDVLVDEREDRVLFVERGRDAKTVLITRRLP